MALRVLTESDVLVLKEIVARVRGSLTNPQSRPGFELEGHQAPEVYIARTPEDGIDGITEESGSSSGSIAGAGDAPGCADCDIYRIVNDGSECGSLVPVSSLFKRVYNLSSTAIAGDTWVQVHRDKYGHWLAITGGGGEGFPETRFVKCVVTTPTAGGLFDALLMDENADGTLTVTATQVWIREGNLLGKLTVSKVFWCKLTGEASGRDVYTCIEKALTVQRSDGTQSFGPHIHTIQFAIPEHWEITEPSTGIAMVRPDRLTVTFQYCDGDGTLWELEFIDGLLVDRTQVEE